MEISWSNAKEAMPVTAVLNGETLS